MQAAATKHEGTKCAFVDAGAPAVLAGLLRQPGLSDEAVILICGSLRTFATADDARPTTSRSPCSSCSQACCAKRSGTVTAMPKAGLGCCLEGLAWYVGRRRGAGEGRAALLRAFQNGRSVANAGVPEALLHILQGEAQACAPAVAAAVCNAMRRIAVNDDICNDFADKGGLAATLHVRRSLPARQHVIVELACSQQAWSVPMHK